MCSALCVHLSLVNECLKDVSVNSRKKFGDYLEGWFCELTSCICYAGLVVSKGVESSMNPVTHSTGKVKTSGKFLYGDKTPPILNQVDVTEFQGNQLPSALVPDTPSTRRQLRRVIMQYGLEYGPPCGPRLTIHHGPLRKCSNKKNFRLVSAALIGVAGLLCVGATIRNQGWSYQPEISSVGLAVGRKLMTICGDTNRIWWVKDSGTTFGYVCCPLPLSLSVSFAILHLNIFDVLVRRLT